MARRGTLLALALAGLLGCKTGGSPAAGSPGLEPNVQATREPLQVTPLEIVFSGVRGRTDLTESVTVRAVDDHPVALTGFVLEAIDAHPFRLVDAPKGPVSATKTRAVDLQVGFAPSAFLLAGVYRATLRVRKADGSPGPPVDIAALVTRGEGSGAEPPLAQVVDALGFSLEAPIAASVFRRAKPGQVGLSPVARFSRGQPAAYGHYPPGQPAARTRLGALAPAANQTLNPDLEPDAETTFDPNEAPFGVFMETGTETTHSDARLNTGPRRRAMRVHPLRSRDGTPIPDAFLLTAEVDGDDDNQDLVLLLWNGAVTSL